MQKKIRKKKTLPRFAGLFLLQLCFIPLLCYAEERAETVQVPSLSNKQIAELETQSTDTFSEYERDEGIDEDVEVVSEDNTHLEPIEIEILPQEEISDPEFLEHFTFLDKEETSPKAQSQVSSSETPKKDIEKIKNNTYVILQGLDKVTARVFTFEARLGEMVEFQNLQIIPYFCQKSAPEEPPETTVFLKIHEKTYDQGTRLIFSGWMFSSSPTSSALEHPIYDVWIKGARIRTKKQEEKESEPKAEEIEKPEENPAPEITPKAKKV